MNNCLNCGKLLEDKYCSGCGQKADTHRITFKNFIFHDVLHGTFHIDKGILFTAKEALVRPGQAALDYIAGKRKRYYNVFYLILITIAVLLFLRNIDHYFTDVPEGSAESKQYLNEASRKLDQIISSKSKIILFLFVPFSAINSFLLFRKKRLNLSEHCILSGMILLGVLLISVLAHLYFPINYMLNLSSDAASYVVIAITLVYISFGYYNAFRNLYSKFALLLRVLLLFVLLFAEIFLLFMLSYGYVTHWKFGEIHVTPFG
ncbi:DUF3667 domain-containing protein [Flavobacterium sp.]|uniref:DUF3667 domain-containing protein n=1 Tax=Flavobacterium sp. TaxID=239 RepID=UPI003B9A3A0A